MRRGPHGHLVPVPVADAGVAPDARIVLGLVAHLLIDDVIGLPLTILEVAPDHTVLVTHVALFANLWRVVAKRLFHIENGGQGLVLDVDQIKGGIGNLHRRRGNRRDLVPDESRDAIQDLAPVVVPDSHPVEAGSVLVGHHAENTRQGQGPGGVDALDPGMGHGAALDLAVHHPGKNEIDPVFE